MMVAKHQNRLNKIMGINMDFGLNALSTHKRKLGELTNEDKLKQTNRHHQMNHKFKLTELNNKINEENHVMLKKLVDISIGRRGNIVDRNAPRLTMR